MTEPENNPRRRVFDTASPYDKPSMDARARKAYERKVMNIGLVLIMLVIAGMGIAAHKIITSLPDSMDNLTQNFDIGKVVPETPFSPIPSPPPVMPVEKRAPTTIDLPDTPVPHSDPTRRRVMAGIAAKHAGSSGTALSIYYFIPEENQNCVFSAYVPRTVPAEENTILVEYNVESADICMTSRIIEQPK